MELARGEYLSYYMFLGLYRMWVGYQLCLVYFALGKNGEPVLITVGNSTISGHGTYRFYRSGRNGKFQPIASR